MTEKNIKRILVTRTDRLGDVILSTPVLRQLRKQYPGAHIAFMVRPEYKDVVINNPDIDEVLLYDKYGEHGSFAATGSFGLSLRKKSFDMGIALHPTNRVHLMMYLARIPTRIGYDRKLKFLLTIRIPHEKHLGDMHEVDYNLKLLESAGMDITDAERKPYMITGPEDKKLVDKLLRCHGVKGEYITVHPGASCPSKRWPPDRFAEVIRHIVSEYGYQCLIIGGEETGDLSRSICDKVGGSGVFDLTGLLHFGGLAELLSRSRLLISNDSGPVHVSVAVGAPVVVIFGRKDPGLSPLRWGPLGERDKVIHGEAGCDVCRAHDCVKEFACLRAVSPREVIDAAGQLLE